MVAVGVTTMRSEQEVEKMIRDLTDMAMEIAANMNKSGNGKQDSLIQMNIYATMAAALRWTTGSDCIKIFPRQKGK